MSFPLAVAFTGRWEGGKDDDPSDPGGRTFMGITQQSFASWLRVPLEGCQDVWTATPDQVVSFFKDWWQRMGAPGYDGVDERLGIIMFDACVQHGNNLAVRFLQRAMKIDADGKFGPQSYAKLHLCYHDDPQGLLLDTVRYRKEHYMERGLKPELTKFLGGWLSRADDCRNVAQSPVSDLVSVVRAAHHSAPLPIQISGVE